MHALTRPEHPKFCINKEPWKKVSQTAPLSRITATHKTQHGYHWKENRLIFLGSAPGVATTMLYSATFGAGGVIHTFVLS
jgi:Flp pilus assembly protein TadB